MPTSTIALIQEALDAASWDLKHWTAILPFDISSVDSSGALVDSQIPDLFEFAKPMYRGQKVCFAGKYNMESVRVSLNAPVCCVAYERYLTACASLLILRQFFEAKNQLFLGSRS